MSKRLKIVSAGPLRYEYLVPITTPESKKRGKKQNVSTAAQQFMNLKNSWRQLELLIAENFGNGDLVVTYTYDDEHLPADKNGADILFQKHVRKLRASRRARGEELKYIYNTEGLHGKEGSSDFDCFDDSTDWEDGRLHHHVIINGTGNDYEELRSLWDYGVYIRVEPLNIHYLSELARYMTKEAREFGRGKPGERTWKCSRNLRPYRVEYDDVRDSMTLTAPHGAVDFTHIEEPSPEGYGEFKCTRYLLLEPEKVPAYSYNQTRRKRE